MAKKKRTKLTLDNVTHEDIIISLFVRTLIDALDYSDQDYWNIKNIRDRIRFVHSKLQKGSMEYKIKYIQAHEMSDIAWQKSRQDGAMMFSAIASLTPLIRKYEDNFKRLIGPVDEQLNAIVKRYYGRKDLEEVKLNSWKIMLRFIKHTNQVIYDWEKDKENYLIDNKVSDIQKFN